MLARLISRLPIAEAMVVDVVALALVAVDEFKEPLLMVVVVVVVGVVVAAITSVPDFKSDVLFVVG